MGNRIYTAPEVLEARVDAAIQALNTLYGKKEMLRGLGEGFSAKVKLWRDRLTLQRNTPFTITVCGEFKRGKSTFINALLGEEVVPTDILPETCTVNRLLYGPHRNEAALSDGRRMQLLDDELCRERIQQHVSENGEPFLNITLYRPLEMLRDIMIVDTPGLNDTEDFNGQVMDMVAQSDAVIYLFSAETPLSLHEQLFLRNVVLPIEGVDLFAICNFMDRLPASEIDRFVHMTKERMDLVLPNQEIWAVSALDECCRIEGVERPNPQSAPRLEETFDRLRERLEKYKSLKHEIAISDRNERILNAIRRDLRVELEKTRAILTEERDTMAGKIAGERENLDHLAEKVGAIPERIAACAMEMKDEARGWFSELLDRVESDIPSLEKIDREIIIKYYSFYCTDLLEEALRYCAQTHIRKLADRAQCEMRDLLEEKEVGAVSLANVDLNDMIGFSFALDNRSWTRGDTLGWVGSALTGGSGLIGLAIDGIAGKMRSSTLKRRQDALTQLIQTQFGELRSSVNDTLTETYRRMAEEVNKCVRQEIQERLEARRAFLEHGETLLHSDDAERQRVLRDVEDAEATLKSIENVI